MLELIPELMSRDTRGLNDWNEVIELLVAVSGKS